jgi:chromosome segregation ATPase
MNYFQLVREVDLIRQEEKIDSLYAELEKARLNGEVVREAVEILQEENEELRKLMQEYVDQINDLNNKNVKLSMGLDQEKDPKVVELRKQIETISAKINEAERQGVISVDEMDSLKEEKRLLELKLEELVKQIAFDKKLQGQDE